MLTFVESPAFTKQCTDLWSDAEYSAFQHFLAARAEAGDLIPGLGGLRKVRWTRPGMGKRGGVRVIYMLRNAQGELVLLTLYTKAEHDTLTNAFLRSLAQLYEE